MQPSLFDDAAPLVPVVSVPVAGRTAAKQCQREGRKRAARHRPPIHVLMLAQYDECPVTDAEMAQRIGIQRSTINARRGELVKAGLVRAVGRRKNQRSGVNNTIWGRR